MITVMTDPQGAYPDASEERLVSLVERIGDDINFVIVERDDAPGFAQATSDASGFMVEYKAPDGEMWQARTTALGDAVTALSGWALDRRGWRDHLTWTSIGRFD